MNKSLAYRNGVLSYRVTGEGLAVVLIHGLAEDGRIWNAQASLLAAQYRVILPDLPGSGGSSFNGDVSMESMADAVKCILDEEGITEAVIIGHSMGGYVTLAFAEKYPALLRALGLFHSTAYADGEEKKASRQKNIHFIRAHGTYEFLKQSVPVLFSEGAKLAGPELAASVIDQFTYINPESLAAYNKAMMMRPDRTAILEHFGKPVLFIIGRHDKAVPVEDSLRLTHLPVISYIHILEDSGHMGMLEETEKSNHILNAFLQQVFL